MDTWIPTVETKVNAARCLDTVCGARHRGVRVTAGGANALGDGVDRLVCVCACVRACLRACVRGACVCKDVYRRMGDNDGEEGGREREGEGEGGREGERETESQRARGRGREREERGTGIREGGEDGTEGLTEV